MKRDKLLNILIYILIFLILVVVGILIYINFFIKEYSVTFNINGATTLVSDKITCKKSIRGCYVVMPRAERNNGKVLGYSTNKNDEKGLYAIGQKVYFKEDTNLYVISLINHRVHIDNNGVDYLEKDDISCNAYNENNTCKVTFPSFNKIGYQNAGYSVNKDKKVNEPSEYYPMIEAEINSDFTVYPMYTSHRANKDNIIYSNDNVYSINGTFIEFEKTLSADVINKYKGFLKEISENAPFLFVGQKINILSTKTFQNTWSGLSSIDGIILGVCYESVLKYPLSRSIDVFYFSMYNDTENYRTLVHEMSHAFDAYYGYAVNSDATISNVLQNNSQQSVYQELEEKYNNGRISSQKDIVSLLKKYINSKNRPIDNEGYAYTSYVEFVAEGISWYYMEYIIKNSDYKDDYFPDDLKTTIEHYICIAKNNYQKNAC